MTTVVEAVRRALHARMAIACEAALPLFPAGSFAVWNTGDSLAVRSAVPALGFLTTLSVPEAVDPAVVEAAIDDARWEGLRPRVILTSEPDADLRDALTGRAYVASDPRPMATRALSIATEPQPHARGDLAVEAVPERLFDEAIAVLVSGYAAGDEVSRFIAAEHRDPRVHLLAVREGSRLVAVSAMSIHDKVVVIGGASTLPDSRGRGGQSMLLRARLALAAAEGCTLAVATAAPESPSLRNLGRAGFTIHVRPSFALPRAGVDATSV